MVSTRHNTDSWRIRRTWKRPFFLWWERAAQRRCAATVAVSAAVRDFLVREEQLDADRFVVIPNGIDLAPYRSPLPRNEARARLWSLLGPPQDDKDQGTVLVGFVGRLAAQKGVDVLLDALALTDGRVRLILVGDGPERAALQERAGDSSLAGRVHFLGHRDDVPELLRGLDAVVMPSRWEGFGLAAVEAMASGVPVIASAVDGLREVVVNGVTGRLVSPGDPAALARCLGELADEPDRYRAWGEVARTRAFEHFGSERMARDVVLLYRRLLGWPADRVQAAGPPAATSRTPPGVRS